MVSVEYSSDMKTKTGRMEE